MANICNNWVEISGDETQVKEFIALVGKDFDFNKIIPIKDDSRKEAANCWGCNSIAFDTIFDGDEDCANWYFWTKWNPPYELYKILVDKFPNIFIYWRYEESGNGLYGYLNDEKEEIKIHLMYENSPVIMTIPELLEEVNRDRSDEWTNYVSEDILIHGIESILEWIEYSLDHVYYSKNE